MKNPDPINLMTPEESRSLGWQAEARDADGHLCSQHAPFEGDQAIVWYVRDALARGQVVTIWPVGVPENPDTATPFGIAWDDDVAARAIERRRAWRKAQVSLGLDILAAPRQPLPTSGNVEVPENPDTATPFGSAHGNAAPAQETKQGRNGAMRAYMAYFGPLIFNMERPSPVSGAEYEAFAEMASDADLDTFTLDGPVEIATAFFTALDPCTRIAALRALYQVNKQVFLDLFEGC